MIRQAARCQPTGRRRDGVEVFSDASLSHGPAKLFTEIRDRITA
jgi:hypothetical protein